MNEISPIILIIASGFLLILAIVTIAIAFGRHTNIDDPLDDKFWKK
jgi:hypothetical protein